MLIPEPTAAHAADVIAIQHLAAGYAEAISRGEVEEAVQGYAPNGVLASPTTEDAVGHDAIAKVLRGTTSGLEFVSQQSIWGSSTSTGPWHGPGFRSPNGPAGAPTGDRCSFSASTRTT